MFFLRLRQAVFGVCYTYNVSVKTTKYLKYGVIVLFLLAIVLVIIFSRGNFLQGSFSKIPKLSLKLPSLNQKQIKKNLQTPQVTINPIVQNCNNAAIFSAEFLNEIQVGCFLSTPVPNEPVEEKITFAVNKGFVDKYPNWHSNADELINSINSILAINTQKQLKIEKYMTYDETVVSPSNLGVLAENNNYFYPNGDDLSLWGGMTIFYYISPTNNLPATSGGSSGAHFEKNYGVVYEYETEEQSPLRGIAYYRQTFGDTWQDQYNQAIRYPLSHEIGHALGLASPDWYNVSITDLTNEQPILHGEDLPSPNVRYPNDPMTTGGQYPTQFSDLNAEITNRNLMRGFNSSQIFSVLLKNIVVRVRDANGVPVQNATVKVFGMDRALYSPDVQNPNASILRQTVITNANGEIGIVAPLDNIEFENMGHQFTSEIIKASKDSKHGGGYVDFVMLQKARIIDGLNTYYLDIALH